MKKIFYCMSLFVATMLTACSSDDNVQGASGEETPTTPIEILKANAAKFGTKNSEVSVIDPTTVKANAKRKACDVNSNLWAYTPDVISDEEKAEVLAYIATMPEGVNWPGYQYYFLQSLGGANHTYYYKDYNKADHYMPGTTAFELLTIVESDGTIQTVNNFASGVINNNNNCMLMTNGFRSVYASLNENSSSLMNKWRLFYYKGYYYLGLDYELHKDDGDITPDGKYDDCVLKIIPYNSDKTPEDPGVDPDPSDDPSDPGVDPDPSKKGEVEFDVHQQDHKDWNEIKTSIHLRDSVKTRLFIPVPQEYQALADDFDIRIGDQAEYAVKTIKIGAKTYTINVTINHSATGIEILLDGTTDEMKAALKAAREIWDDGITVEVHSYVYSGDVNNNPSHETIWTWLKTVECLQSTLTGTPKSGDCATHTYGQVHSAYYESQMIRYIKDPE